MSPGIRKPTTLLLLALAGGGLVLLWPLVGRLLPTPVGPQREIPMISPAAAQQRVRFPLWIPGQIPAEGQLLGVRVSEPRVRNAAQVLAWARAHRQSYIMTGTGLVVYSQGGWRIVRGLPGSPAARAGIGPGPQLLLSLDGAPAAKLGRVSPAELHRLRPVRVTYRAVGGEPRTVVLKYETFTIVTAPPEIHKGLEAALILMAHGKSAALIEKRSTGYFSPPPPDARQAHIAGRVVYLTGPAASPTASWTSGRTSFRLDNPLGALNESEVVEFVGSLHPI